MRSSLHVILVLAAILGLVWGNPARNSRQLEEGSGDDLGDKSVTETVDGAPDDESKVNTSQESESETSDSNTVDESQNEVKVDGPTEDESLAEAEKKDNEKCKKCLKPSWRGRHSSICESCEKKGVIKPIDEHDEKHNEKCKKCDRQKFKARHGIFCSECPVPELYEEEKNVKSEQKKHTKNVTNKSKHEIKENEDEEERKTEGKNKITKKKEHKNKNKNHGNSDKSKDKEVMENKNKIKNKTHHEKHKNNKHKNKNNKEKNKKNKNKNKEEPKKESSGIKFATTVMEVKDVIKPVETDQTNLGPIGSLIKYLVESNTFTK